MQRQPSVGVSTNYTHDGQDVILDSNSTATAYINGLGIDNKLKQTIGSTTSYFLTEHLGNTVGLADSNGSLVAQTSYDSFGNPTSALPMRYGFTGREHDEYAGLMYYRARFYDPQIGRFISEDPIGFAGGDINLYGYVWNSPLKYRDPLGLDGWGNDTADWLDERIAFARQSYHYTDQEWVQNGVNDAVAQVVYGFSDLLRVGNGIGHAIYAEDENGYGRAQVVAMDIGRAAGLFTLLGGAATRVSGGVRGGAAPKSCKTGPICFVEGTLVQTKDGEKPIEEVKEGDEVLSFDEETRQVEYKPVTQTFVRYSPVLLSVYVEGEENPIGVTPEHPFYVHRARSNLSSGDEDDEGEWVGAGDLRVGDKVRLANGNWAGVIGVERRFGGATVYNFEVADNHNYFVGLLGALVHNQCNGVLVRTSSNTPNWITPGSLTSAEEQAVLNTLTHIDAGTTPAGALGRRWGTTFRNHGGDLPGVVGGGGYLEYRVAPPPGVSGAGVRRIVVDQASGRAYYTWTHYGDTGSPAFVRIR